MEHETQLELAIDNLVRAAQALDAAQEEYDQVADELSEPLMRAMQDLELDRRAVMTYDERREEAEFLIALNSMPRSAERTPHIICLLNDRDDLPPMLQELVEFFKKLQEKA